LKFSVGCVHFAYASIFYTDNTDRSEPDKATAMQTFRSAPPEYRGVTRSAFGAERQVCIVVALSGGPIREIRGKIREILLAAPPGCGSRNYFEEMRGPFRQHLRRI
jgi:hypothetical protein